MENFHSVRGLNLTMLVFFIHGVATRTVQYADNLKLLIKNEFDQRGESLPHLYSSFWGNILTDVDKIWNFIHQDLQKLKKEHSQTSIDDIFRYKELRQGFLSQFGGDFLTYFNPERGEAIRKLIAQQLYDFLKNNSEETELHIVAHSLGSVILWDVLFSERFSPQDPATDIRAMIHGFNSSSNVKKVTLKSLTTMGSPILFLNTMLQVSPETVKKFADNYEKAPLRWINMIHSSDVIAYPLGSSLNINSVDNLFFRDEYVSTNANPLEKAARSIGQLEAAMALGAADGHAWYWQCQRTASLIADNILGEKKAPSLNDSMLQEVTTRLYKVPGMTNDQENNSKVAIVYLKFKDGSGTLRVFINPLQVHHVYVFDNQDVCNFGGYVGWLHTTGLKEELEFIKRKYC
ncbi:hypothetical protein [Coleofasciculus sp. FACHB-712]|uniref:hypothetical protein n=1 Tax=Coleofasciculus sp. FACHB-712 TaxID=2692789 RepID=UPI001F549F19|nr:hypothetical protein [Coleofasciculus sp. FACHB-712]